MRKQMVVAFVVTVLFLSSAVVAALRKGPPLHPALDVSGGLTGQTLLTTTNGCSCHGAGNATVSFTTTAGVATTSTQLFPGETGTFRLSATTSTAVATGSKLGVNIAATAGAGGLSESEAALEIVNTEIKHNSAVGTLKSVNAGSSNFYTFSFILTSTAVPANWTIAGIAAVGPPAANAKANAASITVTSRRPADPANLAAGTPTASSVPLNWTGTGPAYRVIGKPGSYSTSPTDTVGAVVQDVSTNNVTSSGLNPATQYFFRVWGRASFGGINTYSTNPSETTATTAAPPTWHVNVATGNNTNSGMSAGAPFKTITHALLVAGMSDTILVYPGTYNAGSGEAFPLTSSNSVQLKSTAGAASTLIDAASAARVFELFNLTSGALIEGFTITGGRHQPNGQIAFEQAQGGAIYADFNDVTTISRNIIKGNLALGYAGNATNTEGGSARGGALYTPGNRVIVNNVIRDNIANGGAGFGSGANGGNASGGGVYGGATLINNTYYANQAVGGVAGSGGLAGQGQGGGQYFGDNLINNIFANNSVFGGTGTCCGAQSAGGLVDHNLFFGSMVNSAPSTDPNVGTNAVTADPLFTSVSDLHILAASPARGAGTATGAPAADLDGRTRPAPPSIGAYEPKRVAIDFNGDGKPDQLLRDTSNGDVGIWFMDGLTITSGAVAGMPGLTFRVAGAGDFDADGKTDILLQNTSSGDVGIWKMNGATITAGAIVGTPGTDWTAVTAADINGDGRADIVLQNTSTGAVGAWEMNGFTITGAGAIGNPGTPNWQVVGSGDFNSDGKSDLVLRNSSTGDIGAWNLNGLMLTSGALIGSPGTEWEVAGAVDLDGSGGSDLVIRNTSSGDVGGWILTGTSITGAGVIASPGTSWGTRGGADFNLDGKGDIVVQNSSGDIGRWQMNGLTITSGALFGSPGSIWQAVWNR